MSKILMPSEEWGEFRDSALHLQHSPEAQAFLKLAFVAGLSSASEFFQNLISCEFEADKKQDLFQRWMAGITTELENYAEELLRFSEGENGRTN